MKKKKCSLCKEKKTLSEFFVKIKSRNIYYSGCKTCLNIKRKLARNLLKQKAVQYKGGKCQICGYDKYVGALTFHHVNPKEKEFQISQMDNNFNSIKLELDKCLLACANCHAEIHGNITKIPFDIKRKFL